MISECGHTLRDVKGSAMLRKALFSAAAALSMFSVANVEASDRFSLGLNLGGNYPVYQPAPVIVNPYPTVVNPSYGYGYQPSYGYGSYGYGNPGVNFNYSNYNAYRPVRQPNYSGYRGPVRHHDHHHHCW
jgi:hypothetical protein